MAWHNAILRGTDLYQAGHDIQTIDRAMDEIVTNMEEQLCKHSVEHWTMENFELLPRAKRAQRNILRDIKFLPELVKPYEMYNLQVCARDSFMDSTPLFVGLSGTPIVVAEREMPDNFLFPVTWDTSPFEKIYEYEQTPHHHIEKPSIAPKVIVYPQVEVANPQISEEPKAVKEFHTSQHVELKSFQMLPASE